MDTTTPNRDLIRDMGLEDAIVFENPDYDSAIIGVSHDDRVVYSYARMIEHLVLNDEMDPEEAAEFIDYNTLGALPGIENGPIVVHDIMFG